MAGDQWKRPQVLEHLGPYVQHPPVAQFGEILESCFSTFHQAIEDNEDRNETPRQHLISRLMYISESTSVSARLSASWALSIPAMSLIRDRYEQVCRFSWLARQQDPSSIVSLLSSYYSKANQVYRNQSPLQKNEFHKTNPDVEEWMKQTPNKSQKEFFGKWNKLSLEAICLKRDKLSPLSDGKLDTIMLHDFYNGIYRQFSSVTHYDGYSLQLLGLYEISPGQLALAPDPNWPATLAMFDSLFSLIQCHEALLSFYDIGRSEFYDSLYEKWQKLSDAFSAVS